MLNTLAAIARTNAVYDHADEDIRRGARALCWTLGSLVGVLQVGVWFLLPWYLALLADLLLALAALVVNTRIVASVSDESFEALGAKLGSAWNFVRNPLRKASV